MIDLGPLEGAEKPMLVIAGATAAGKSALALDVAASTDAVIINADSMQVYDAIPVLTAQPSEADHRAAKHALYGMLAPDDLCSAARWSHMAKEEIAEAWAIGALPIVVGGTGLYLRTLLDGISPIPDIDDSVRAKVRLLAADGGGEALFGAVSAVDPAIAARLEQGDTQRLSRALEVAWSTGKPLSEWQKLPPTGGLAQQDHVAIQAYVVARDRGALYARCDARLEHMLAQGALEELEALLGMDVPSDAPILRAVAVPPLRSYLAGTVSRGDAVSLAQRDTRRFAKRQLTWLRQQFGDWKQISLKES